MFWIDDADAIYRTLELWDASDDWPNGLSIRAVILGGGAVAFYGVSRHRTTADLDLWLDVEQLSTGLATQAEVLGLSFRASAVAWVAEGWERRIRWSSRHFKHLRFGWFDPYDWIITKLGRWLGHDMDDALAVVRGQQLDPPTLHDRVRQALPDYIGNERNVRMAWHDLADAMGWSSDL